MASQNSIRLLNGTTTNGVESERINIQGTRDESIGFWVFISPASGATLSLRGGPDVQGDQLTTPNGMLLHTVISTGTAATGQTKVNSAGHALVYLPALPQMWVLFNNALAPTNACWVWLIE